MLARMTLCHGAIIGCLISGAGSLLMMAQTAEARPQYVNRVPTRYSCDTCHLSAVNRNLRTGFGIDFGLNRGVWANDDPQAGICRLDSDGDGLTNGEELADPECTWRVGDRLPAGPMTNPANPRDPDRCGDGEVQEGEACDGDDVGENTCASEGFMDGQLACDDACALDVSGCVPFPEPDQAVPLDMGAPDIGVADLGPIDAETAPDIAAPVGDARSPSSEGDAAVDARSDGADSSALPIDSSLMDSSPASDAIADSPPVPIPRDGGGCMASEGGALELPLLLLIVGALRRRRAH